MKLILIRGLPGSGKSTLAELLSASVFDDVGWGVCHYEADQYFWQTGEYIYDKNKIVDAHIWCRGKVKEALANNYSVIVANTFTRLWEMQPYLDMAKEFNAEVTIITCEGDYGNVHGVPDETVKKMRERFEPYRGEVTECNFG